MTDVVLGAFDVFGVLEIDVDAAVIVAVFGLEVGYSVLGGFEGLCLLKMLG